MPDLQGTKLLPLATEQGQSLNATEQRRTQSPFLCGCSALMTDTGKLIMNTLATAMRAANVADFYMTKYLSKAQEALGPVMQPFIAGMRRISEAESAPDTADTTLVQQARQRIRRFIFCATRTMWFSACELGVFLATGDSCIRTEPTMKAFSGKGIAMMYECQRLLNHSTAEEGLLLVHRSTQQQKPIAMDAFLVEQPSSSDTDTANDEDLDTDSAPDDEQDATEQVHGDHSDALAAPVTKKQRKDSAVVATEPTVATERGHEQSSSSDAIDSTDDCGETLPAVVTSAEAATAITDASAKKPMFTTTFTHRDDWLHRGIMLRDMDYYHYARYMQRVEMPRLGSAANFQKKHGAYFLFDTHYPLARSYVQILRKKPCTVQNVGPHCKRSEVNGGEDNAVYQLDVPVYTEIAFPLLVTISETQSH